MFSGADRKRNGDHVPFGLDVMRPALIYAICTSVRETELIMV